jgi:hypothetical protein
MPLSVRVHTIDAVPGAIDAKLLHAGMTTSGMLSQHAGPAPSHQKPCREGKGQRDKAGEGQHTKSSKVPQFQKFPIT